MHRSGDFFSQYFCEIFKDHLHYLIHCILEDKVSDPSGRQTEGSPCDQWQRIVLSRFTGPILTVRNPSVIQEVCGGRLMRFDRDGIRAFREELINVS